MVIEWLYYYISGGYLLGISSDDTGDGLVMESGGIYGDGGDRGGGGSSGYRGGGGGSGYRGGGGA